MVLCVKSGECRKQTFQNAVRKHFNLSTGKLKNVIVNQVDSMEQPWLTWFLKWPLLLAQFYFLFMFVLDWRVSLLALVPLVIGMFLWPARWSACLKCFPKQSKSVKTWTTRLWNISTSRSLNLLIKAIHPYKNTAIMFMPKQIIASGWVRTTTTMRWAFSTDDYFNHYSVWSFLLYAGSLTGANLLMLIILSFSCLKYHAGDVLWGRYGSHQNHCRWDWKKFSTQRVIHATGTQNYDITFDHVNFSYDDNKQVIRMSICTSMKVVSMHSSGILAQEIDRPLLAGFWDTDSGSITIGGIALTDMPL